MDNRINEIRRKVSALRARMIELEALARNQVKHDLDCAEAAGRQLALRREMVGLIAGATPIKPGEDQLDVWRFARSVWELCEPCIAKLSES